MNLKHITLLLLVFGSLCFSSCNDTDSENVVGDLSKDAQIASFSLSAPHNKTLKDSLSRATDSIRFVLLGKTKFAINQVTSDIYNPDSLMYGTVLGKVATSVTFVGSPTAIAIMYRDSVNYTTWNGTDSIDFSKKPIALKVTAADGVSTKTYSLDIRIHKINPDSIIWQKMSSLLSNGGKQKTVLLNNKFYSYSIKSGVLSLNILPASAASSLAWVSQAVNGLPATVDLQSITVLNNTVLAITTTGSSYYSSDGITFIPQANGKNVKTIFGVLPGATADNDSVLVRVLDGTKSYYGKTKDFSAIKLVNKLVGFASDTIVSNFPVNGFANATNFSRDPRTNMLLLTCGSDMKGNDLGATWLILNASTGLQITSFNSNMDFVGEGFSTFLYANKLYALVKNQLYTSQWGEQWTKAPAVQNLPFTNKRTESSAIVDQQNNIWIFGGVSEQNVSLTDVWKGRLNRL